MKPQELKQLEDSLWEAADRLRANSKLNATEYSIPVLELKVAAGGFSIDQVVAAPGDFEWIELDGKTSPGTGLFIAKVVGESMNRRIPNGAWCLWRANPTGTRQARWCAPSMATSTNRSSAVATP